MSREDLRSVAGVNRVIQEPARLLIVALLAGVTSADFLHLERESGLTRGNLSSHLSRLETAGYVAIEKTFRVKIPLTLARLTPRGRAAFEAYRKRMHGVLKAG